MVPILLNSKLTKTLTHFMACSRSHGFIMQIISLANNDYTVTITCDINNEQSLLSYF